MGFIGGIRMHENNANFMDAVNIVALLIGILNMIQNQEQTAFNDVNAANEAEAQFLLEELGKKFDEQNQILKEHTQMLKEILDRLQN